MNNTPLAPSHPSRLSPEQHLAVRRRFILSGESVGELTLAFPGSSSVAIKRALTPDARALRDALLVQPLTAEQFIMATDECLSDSAKAAEWYEKSRRFRDPVATFLAECTVADPKAEMLRDALWDCWCKWSEEQRMCSLTKGRLYERMRSIAPHAISDGYDKDGIAMRVFRGIALTPAAAQKYPPTPTAKIETPTIATAPVQAAAPVAMHVPATSRVVAPTEPADPSDVKAAPVVRANPFRVNAPCIRTERQPSQAEMEAWEFINNNRGDKPDSAVERAWLVACQLVGGKRDEDDFTPSDWAKVKDFAMRELSI
jgi:hypothetical protein